MLLLLLGILVPNVLSHVTVQFASLNCAPNALLRVSEACQYSMTIIIPPLNWTALSISVMSQNTDASYMMLCKPQVNITHVVTSLNSQFKLSSDFLAPSQVRQKTLRPLSRIISYYHLKKFSSLIVPI